MREFFFPYKVKREEAREVNGGKKNMVPTLPLLRFPSNLNKNRPERPRARPWARPSSTASPAASPRPARPRLFFSPRKESPSRRRLPVPRQRLAAAFFLKKNAFFEDFICLGVTGSSEKNSEVHTMSSEGRGRGGGAGEGERGVSESGETLFDSSLSSLLSSTSSV
jgi:hypothetical protein